MLQMAYGLIYTERQENLSLRHSLKSYASKSLDIDKL